MQFMCVTNCCFVVIRDIVEKLWINTADVEQVGETLKNLLCLRTVFWNLERGLVVVAYTICRSCLDKLLHKHIGDIWINFFIDTWETKKR